MKKLAALSLAVFLSASFAENRWVSGVTVKAVKSRPNTTASYFVINEGVSGYSKWYFDNSTSGGKAILASLLTAIATGLPVSFHETTCSTQYSECEISEVLIGNVGAF